MILLGVDGGVNTYLYANANPLVNVDESGEFFSYIDPIFHTDLNKIKNTFVGYQLYLLAEIADYPIDIIKSNNSKTSITYPYINSIYGYRYISGYKIVISQSSLFKYFNFRCGL